MIRSFAFEVFSFISRPGKFCFLPYSILISKEWKKISFWTHKAGYENSSLIVEILPRTDSSTAADFNSRFPAGETDADSTSVNSLFIAEFYPSPEMEELLILAPA